MATQIVVGPGPLGECPRNEREDWEIFTNHSYRRTAETRMTEKGATILDIQINKGWKSKKLREDTLREVTKLR